MASVISGSAEVIRDEEGAAILPSVVHYAADGTVTVGAKALRDASNDAKNTISSAKRLIGRTMKDLDDVHNLPYDLWMIRRWCVLRRRLASSRPLK